MATYNGAKYLEEQLQSLFSQTYTNWVLLASDDGSTDETIQILQQYQKSYPGKIKLLQPAEKKLGSTFNFSRLLQSTTADYIMLCDQDDVWMVDKIELQMQEMLKMETEHGKDFPLLVCSDLAIVDEQLQTLQPSFFRYRKQTTNILNDSYKLIAHSTITGCTMLLNKAAIKIAVPIKIKNFQHDHWISMHVAHYGKISCIDQPLVLYRQHNSNVVGASRINFNYLLSRLGYFPNLIKDWLLLKKKATIPVPVAKVFFFKIWYNMQRLFN
mgnify:CR=1 FL=1